MMMTVEVVMMIKMVMVAEIMAMEAALMTIKVEAGMRVEVMMKVMTVPLVEVEIMMMMMMMKGAEVTWCQHFKGKTVELTNKV